MQQIVEDIKTFISNWVPPGDSFILVDNNDDLELGSVYEGSKRFWINEFDRRFDGSPSSASEALREIEWFIEQGATRLIFVWSHWWFDYYTGLHEALHQRYDVLFEDQDTAVFDLNHPRTPPALSVGDRVRSDQVRVGVFGYYGLNNYGDDLMALLFGQAVKRYGGTPVVFNLPQKMADQYGFETQARAQDLAKDCDFAIIGGGGLLCPVGESDRFMREMGRFLTACKDNGVDVAALSIGGDGLPIDQLRPAPARMLAEHAKPLLVRNELDLASCHTAGIEAQLCFDVVWATSLVLPRPRKRETDGVIRVGINLYDFGNLESQMQEAVKAWANSCRDISFYFIDSHTHTKFSAFHPEFESTNFHLCLPRDVDQVIETMLDLDLIISNRLHFGMTAMSYGVPALAFAPLRKAELAFQHVGLDEMCWGLDKLPELPRAFMPEFITDAKQKLNALLDSGIREKSMKAIDIVGQLIADRRKH